MKGRDLSIVHNASRVVNESEEWRALSNKEKFSIQIQTTSMASKGDLVKDEIERSWYQS